MQLLVKIVKDFWIQRHFQDPEEYLRWSFLRKKLTGFSRYFRKNLHLRCSTVLNTSLEVLTTFARSFILDVWRLWLKVEFSFGQNSESNYMEWRLSRGVLEESCFVNLINLILKYMLELFYRNKDKLTVTEITWNTWKGVILKTLKLRLRNDYKEISEKNSSTF